MLLAHISDTHFRSRGEKLYGFIDVNAPTPTWSPSLTRCASARTRWW
ncbi:3',5'-cyclic-nucleotide phosphodiesterase [Klebsiella pneumoniae subsp. ozaenae]|uniref:3',5'-cyclic-nucleotide phosphodiesterase n=1 Tax=Klebsiella pneumoniae subsp. ozaenae TaxID=574 RepID=A0A378B193_KLEPO|nr:3',5'-cyclic-nucleotide phosphodiesterase [Klebsiella pneumoniae subsp. ozaenae]